MGSAVALTGKRHLGDPGEAAGNAGEQGSDHVEKTLHELVVVQGFIGQTAGVQIVAKGQGDQRFHHPAQFLAFTSVVRILP